jgi:hypothetical protein
MFGKESSRFHLPADNNFGISSPDPALSRNGARVIWKSYFSDGPYRDQKWQDPAVLDAGGSRRYDRDMERFQFGIRDLLWLTVLVAVVAYLTRDLRQVLLVLAIYMVVFVIVNRVRVYVQRVLNERPPDRDS